MLLLLEKGIRGGICQAIHQYAATNNKYLKNYNREKDSSYLMYWMNQMGNVSKITC